MKPALALVLVLAVATVSALAIVGAAQAMTPAQAPKMAKSIRQSPARTAATLEEWFDGDPDFLAVTCLGGRGVVSCVGAAWLGEGSGWDAFTWRLSVAPHRLTSVWRWSDGTVQRQDFRV